MKGKNIIIFVRLEASLILEEFAEFARLQLGLPFPSLERSNYLSACCVRDRNRDRLKQSGVKG